MMNKSCWNCGSEKGAIRSELTGIEYCAECLKALGDFRRSITALNEVIEIPEGTKCAQP